VPCIIMTYAFGFMTYSFGFMTYDFVIMTYSFVIMTYDFVWGPGRHWKHLECERDFEFECEGIK
jgi:hypothetical protein